MPGNRTRAPHRPCEPNFDRCRRRRAARSFALCTNSKRVRTSRMASLSLLCQRCTRPAAFAAQVALFPLLAELHSYTTHSQSLPCRSFSTTPAVFAKQNKPKIRVPGKKAMEAKRRRKAALAAKEDEKREKLPLTEAIKVLRVRLVKLFPAFTHLTVILPCL